MNGKIDAESFEHGAKSFAEVWRTCNIGEGLRWNWKAATIRVGEGHLAKGFLVLERFPVKCRLGSVDPQRRREIQTEASLELPEYMHRLDDDVCCSTTTSTRGPDTEDELHLYDYHIAYSPSYQVPMLFFRGYLLDGQELELDQIVHDLPETQRLLARSSTEGWAFLTKEEHPHLHRPYYALHPCQTAALLEVMQSTDTSNLGPAPVSCEHPYEPLGLQQAKEVRLNTRAHASSCEVSTSQGEEADMRRCLRYMLAWFSIAGVAVGVTLPPGIDRMSLPNLTCFDEGGT